MKLLIVDDSLIMRRAIERTLVSSVFTEIRMVSNGRLAVKEYENFMPDIVTMDITMPDMDGLTAVELIIRFDPNARILVVSALADKATAVEAVKRGASGFLLKPITSESLEEAIQDVISE
ncbi:MAG: response regulator [Akkermansiaceae bacterium]|nr:response regulator [Akkermansiaceae bacterium]